MQTSATKRRRKRHFDTRIVNNLPAPPLKNNGYAASNEKTHLHTHAETFSYNDLLGEGVTSPTQVLCWALYIEHFYNLLIQKSSLAKLYCQYSVDGRGPVQTAKFSVGCPPPPPTNG